MKSAVIAFHRSYLQKYCKHVRERQAFFESWLKKYSLEIDQYYIYVLMVWANAVWLIPFLLPHAGRLINVIMILGVPLLIGALFRGRS